MARKLTFSMSCWLREKLRGWEARYSWFMGITSRRSTGFLVGRPCKRELEGESDKLSFCSHFLTYILFKDLNEFSEFITIKLEGFFRGDSLLHSVRHRTPFHEAGLPRPASAHRRRTLRVEQLLHGGALLVVVALRQVGCLWGESPACECFAI